MRINSLKSILKTAVYGATVLLLGAGVADAQTTVYLTAAPTSTTLPDGSTVPMWGYTCGSSSTAGSCAAANPNVGGAWSPVIITVASGTDLQINLTNGLTFTPTGGGAANTVPTSIMILGQLGGGLGTTATSTPSPTHDNQGSTWPIANNGSVFTPPAQGNRVQSFSTEVTVAGGATTLTWTALRPGTYLLESGTHPSIQAPMGLIGMVVVTAPPSGGVAGTAYPNVSYNAEVPLIFSEIDPAQNKAVDTAVRTAGFSESATYGAFLNGPVMSVAVTNGGKGYTSAPTVTFTSGSPTATGTAVIDSDTTSATYGQVTAINIAGGGGYAVSPKVTLTGGGGSGATAIAALQLNANGLAHCQSAGGAAAACYPPVVNYTPLYYLINGAAFDKTNASRSLFAATQGTNTGAISGSVLVRLVNAGLRMHVPSIVGSQTGTANAGGFSLIAEDGNVLPGVPRVQSEVFLAAGKTYDVLINAPTGTSPPALAIYDRELSLSANATARDAGMLAYISVNGGSVPADPALGAATANPDSYGFVVPGKTLTISDPSQGVLANDVNIYGVQVLATATPPAHGTVTLNSNGTFTYVPSTDWTATSTSLTDQFTYCGNGQTSGAACTTVTLSEAPVENASGITLGSNTFTANTATYIKISAPGLLIGATDAAGYPLSIVPGATKMTGAGSFVPDSFGGFTATVPAAGPYTINFTVTNSQGTTKTGSATVNFPSANGPTVSVKGKDPNDPTGTLTTISDYRWVIEEDRTFYVDPKCTANPPPAGCPTAASGIVPTFGTNFHTSYMPVVATGCTGDISCESGQKQNGNSVVCDVGNGACRPGTELAQLDPSQVHLDPTKRYYISVLPGDAANAFETGNATGGHGMGGAPIASGQSSVTVVAEANPYPPAKLAVFVFEDDFPLNGEQDAGGGVDVLAPNEPGLGQFNITIFDDAGGPGDPTGQVNYDMFNQPLSNSLAGTIDPATGLDACPIGNSRTGVVGNPSAPGTTISDSTQTGITGTIVTCPKYEGDGTKKILSPLAGQAIVANMMPGRYGVVATPGADRIARGEEWLQTNTLDGQKAHDSFLRVGEAGYFQEYGPAIYHVAIGFANPQIINSRLAGVCNGTDINVTGSDCKNTVTGKVTTERMSRTPDERLYSSGDNSSFAFTQCYVSIGDTDGEDFAFTKCKSDGTFSISGLPDGDWRVTVFDQWNDMLVDGLSTPVRLSGGAATDLGQLAINQWQSNIYTTTFFDTNGNGVRDKDEQGLSLVPTNIRFRDGSFSNFNSTDLNGYAAFNEVFPLFNWYVVETDATRYKNTGTHVVYDAGGPSDGSTCGSGATPPTAQCGNSTIASFLANTYEANPVPGSLHIPGAVYCTTADCTGQSILDGSNPSATPNSTGRIDPPWVVTEGWQGFSGQNNFLEFGKTPFAAGENGGIRGHVVYASTRPFDDPTLLLQTSWEPLVPNVAINLYQEGTAADGTKSLKLVDTTITSSWDDWAQGFRSDGIPNMNCPGQTTSDSFYFTLYNQPMWLDQYNNVLHGTGSATNLPNNSQFKCYDGMHNWNQLQAAPYDGMYKFPSIAGRDPVTGKPVGGTNANVAGTNCAICIANPTDGTPMLPDGKYVVEVVVPPGYELVKEEDKNILIGDNYIAPVTIEFPGLGGSVYILPDQAEVGSAYNTSNAQNSTDSLGRTTLPSHESDTGTMETYWPCVGEARVVPDFISLFPGSQEVAPFAGATRNLCDRKEVTLDDQTSVLAKFYVFTSTHAAAHFTGVITDDFTSEFDPFSPQFGEKFAPPDLPISIKDWTGTEISRVYTDQWGAYDGLTYSTWEVNPPNPTGYAPTMMVTCMNDPGTGTTPDPLFNPGYSQFCYEIPFMPGQTQYMDTPVTPTTAFSEGYNHPDCAYPDATPAVSEVDGDGVGPWVAGLKGTVTAVQVTSGGSGYTGTPTVTFNNTGTGGTGAAGTALVSGSVTSVHLSDGGRGYTSAPAITFSGGGGGSGASATANMTGSVTSVTIGTGGVYSRSAPVPTVTFSAVAAGCTRATGTANMTNINGTTRRVNTVTITNPGTCYATGATVTFSAGATTATGSINLGESVLSLTLNSGGTGYSSTPTLTFDASPAGNAARATGTAIESASVVAVNITNAGSGYASAPTVSLIGGGGSSATATASIELNGTLTINALGNQTVLNNGYSGPQATNAPFNQKTVTRHYGFGGTQGTGSVTIGGKTATVTAWNDSQITVTVPSGVPSCAVQQQAIYGGSTAQCGELVITAGNGKQSIDTVTVTIGGKAPTLVSASTPMTQTGPGSLQTAIDQAMPGDLLILKPGTYNEMVLMWKPVRLQGVGAASTVLNANTQPEGKMDPWRQKVNCLFGLALNGQPSTANTLSTTNPSSNGTNPFDPTGTVSCGGWTNFTGGPNNPQVDRLPLEGILGWDTTVNGNLAQLLQEPTLMGAYEGAGITVLGKGVRIPANATNVFGSGSESAFPTGTTLLTASDCLTGGGPSQTNPYPSNFQCNPSSIDGLAITDSSQGGGGIFVHAWGHNLQIANNRVYNNTGTLTGGITVGQGESPDAYMFGDAGNADPGSCQTSTGDGRATLTNTQLPYCFDLHVNVHNNSVSLNSSIGDELFSSTPAGGGGVTMCIGADYYKFNYNWVCGNLSTGDGGGLVHLGYIYHGDIEHNSILFNESTNPTVPTNGGGLIVMGAPPDGLTASGLECGNTAADADCTPGLSDGTGPGLVINANLFQGNGAESGSGGGVRFQGVNGTEVVNFPLRSDQWNDVTVTNNIITNNVAGWDGAGVSLQDALKVNIVNNTIVSNDTTASSGVLFNTLGAPISSAPGSNCTQVGAATSSCPQPAGLVVVQNSAVLDSVMPSTVLCPAGHGTIGSICKKYSVPVLYNNVIWQNRAFYIGVSSANTSSTNQTNQQNTVALFNAFTGTPAISQATTDAITANGNGSVITGGTGACVSPASYWEIGVRGDTKPSNHDSGLTLAPTYSVLTDATDYPGANNSASNPTVASQYCNGSRTPPEYQSLGYQVPPGISDATVPNPVFSLTPAATVDEGNNWINISWGPLALTNSVTITTLGNYSLAAGSPSVNYIPTSAAATESTVAPVPTTDFFGNTRPQGGSYDVGAVEYIPPANTPIATVTGGPLSFGNIVVGTTSAAQTLTLVNSGTASVTGINAVITAPFSRSGGTCGATLTAGNNCTINVVFSPTAVGAATGSATITSNVTVNGSPVLLSGTGVAATRTASVSPSPLAFGNWATGTTSPTQNLTVTNTGNQALAGGTFTFGGGTPQPFSRVTTGTFPGGAPNCSATLAVGSTCTIKVQFAPTTVATYSRTLTVAYTGATVTPTTVSLTGTGVAARATMSVTPNPLTITLPSGTLSGSGTVTLTNTAAAGGSTVSVTNVSVTGAGLIWAFTAGTNACTGASLLPGASCTVQVNFTRLGSVGTHTGSITFTDTGAGSPQSGVLRGVAQ